jgi:hypothetical protein
MPKEKRDPIEQQEESFDFLKQSHISEKNVARLKTLASARCREELFAGSEDLLAELADQALTEHGAGRTEKLDPEKL